MKKKSKKKKDKPSRYPSQQGNDAESREPEKNEEESISRNTSRGRRSLSSLFRRSGDDKQRQRSESPEKATSMKSVTDQTVSGEVQDSPNVNPKIHPRKHLGRMTVREALIDSKKRGRSPSRTIVKLEKSVIDNEPRDSLSTSLPHILDQFPNPEDVRLMDHETPQNSGNTLPRSKKRGRALKRVSKNITDNTEWTSGHENNILPLDKRKYMINKTRNSTSLDLPDASKSISNQSPSRSHYTGSSRDISPYNQSSFMEQENLRRESFAHFLQLRGTKTPSHSSTLSVDKGSASAFSLKHEPRTSPFEVVIPGRKSPASDNTIRQTVSPSRKPQISQPFPSNIGKVSHERISVSEKTDDIPKYSEHQTDRDIKGKKRGFYVSPRRFTRNSRLNEKSIKDVSQDENRLSHVANNTTKEETTNKYQRQFSNSSEKSELKKRKAKEQTNAYDNTAKHRGDFKLPDQVLEKPDESILREESIAAENEIQQTKQQTESVNNIIPMSPSNQIVTGEKKMIDTHDEGTQTLDSDIEFFFKSNILPVQTVASSNDIPNMKKENMFIPITDEDDKPLLLDEVSDISNKIAVQQNEIETITPVSKDDANETDASKQDTVSDVTEREDKQDHVKKDATNKKEKKDKRKSKMGKKKSEKMKKKSKSDVQKHDEKSKSGKEFDLDSIEGNHRGDDQQSADRNDMGKHDSDIHIDTIKAEREHDGKLDKEREKGFFWNRKKSRKISSKGIKGKSTEPIPLKKAGRASSLTDISPGQKHNNKVDKSIAIKRHCSVKRARSVEHISSLGELKPVLLSEETMLKKTEPLHNKDIEKETSAVEEIKKEQKPQPKLSIAAIVAIRAKISRMKKAKQQAAKKLEEEEGQNSDDNLKNEKNENQENQEAVVDDDGASHTDNAMQDKVFYENEINASLGRQSQNEDSICVDDNILSLDKEVKDIVYEKRIHFSSFCDDTISEEEMIKQRQRNTRLTSRRESKVRQRQKKFISCCKQAIAFLFSHIGLCSLVIGYCIAGGFIFKALEGDNELKQRAKMENLRLNFTEKIFALAFDTTMEKTSRDQFRIEVESILKKYSQKIFKHTKEAGWDGNDNYRNETEEVEQWSFPSSLLYAITVMTTIGYGHVAPKTVKGRVVTIAYAVLGIPLTLLCLTNIGDVMAHGFRLLYGKVFCGWCCILFQPPRRKRIDPEKGLAVDDKILVHDDEKSEEIIQVPTSVCLLLMSAYIMLGTLAFCRWEHWDFVTGTYFCFITLSTIGFGDVVPGMSSKNWNKNEKLVLCGLYLLFGLSLIAMCFNLVQEDVKAKCKRLGKRLGIIDK